jgi:hypothetical protein
MGDGIGGLTKKARMTPRAGGLLRLATRGVHTPRQSTPVAYSGKWIVFSWLK